MYDLVSVEHSHVKQMSIFDETGSGVVSVKVEILQRLAGIRRLSLRSPSQHLKAIM